MIILKQVFKISFQEFVRYWEAPVFRVILTQGHFGCMSRAHAVQTEPALGGAWLGAEPRTICR